MPAKGYDLLYIFIDYIFSLHGLLGSLNGYVWFISWLELKWFLDVMRLAISTFFIQSL